MKSAVSRISIHLEWGSWIDKLARLVVLLLVSSALAISSAEAEAVRHVLILNSYHSGYKGSDDLVAGINKTLAQSRAKEEGRDRVMMAT